MGKNKVLSHENKLVASYVAVELRQKAFKPNPSPVANIVSFVGRFHVLLVIKNNSAGHVINILCIILDILIQ